MNKISKFLTLSAVAVSLAAILPACSMEAPFGPDNSEGALILNPTFRGDIVKTRADLSADQTAALREKLVIYIENSRGVMRKIKGADNIPESISLKSGQYWINAWSGDSVSASFDSKFYRNDPEADDSRFEISAATPVVKSVKCNIANVLVSVDPTSLDVDMTDLKVTFSHSRGSLEFTSENIPTAKGYFMMPNADKDLNYKVEGKKLDGSAYVKEGVIEGVKRAHEYILSLSSEDRPVTEGGGLIRLEIVDVPVIDETVEIFTPPTVRGVGFDIDGQVVSTNRDFKDVTVSLIGYYGMNSLIADYSSNFTGMTSGQDLMQNSVQTSVWNQGIHVEVTPADDKTASGETINIDVINITFTKAFLDGLAASDTEYTVNFTATDKRGKVGTGRLRIANSENAVEHLAPVGTVETPSAATQPMAILSSTATLEGAVYTSDATNYGIEYREAGTSDWTKAYPSSSQAAAAARNLRNTRAGSVVRFSVTLTGLKPGTTYEYRTFSEGFDGADIMTFTTEAPYVIPNASFENWSTYKQDGHDIVFPGTGNECTFWDSGNPGGATVSMVMTDKSTDMAHSGQYSAKLQSKNALITLAAGNIFIGKFVGIEATSNGILSLGREYNGSHPTKVRFHANYRPGTVDIYTKNSGDKEILAGYGFNKGDVDHGQVYVALVTGPVEIHTYRNVRKLFEPEGDYIVAYGQVTWKEAFGPDGALQEIEIPFEYAERAKTTPATHLVIVAAASKYGDYFSGSSSSVMYLDDFELIYE